MTLCYYIWSETMGDGTVRWVGHESHFRALWRDLRNWPFVLRLPACCLLLLVGLVILRFDTASRNAIFMTGPTYEAVRAECEKRAAWITEALHYERGERAKRLGEKRARKVVSRTKPTSLFISSSLDQGT